MKRQYLQTGNPVHWANMPYMDKEHSVTVTEGPNLYRATVVVVPSVRRNKKGEEVTIFTPMGVRLEKISGQRFYAEGDTTFVIPGPTYYVKYKSQMVSQSDAFTFVTDRCGRPSYTAGVPDVAKPMQRWKGRPIQECPAWIAAAVAKATESYAAWRAAQRAAA